MAGIWLNRGERDRALEHLERARGFVEERGPSPEKAFVLQELARVLMMADQTELAIEVGSQSLRLAEELGLEATRARNLNTIGSAKAIDGEAGLRDLEQAIAIAAPRTRTRPPDGQSQVDDGATGDLRRAGQRHGRP